MKFKRKLNENKEFFDYHTGKVDLLNGDVLDTTTTGVSFYNDLLPNSDQKDYMRNEKNLVGEIEYMTPQEYYEQCSKYGFPNKIVPVEKLKQERRIDKNTLKHLKAVLTEYGHKFPLPYISIAERGQEGLHRMMVIGDMFGWNSGKYPVLIVRFADEERATIEKENKLISKYSSYIRQAIRQTLQYNFQDLHEVKEQLQFDLDREFQYIDDISKPVQFILEEDPTDDNYYLVKVGKAQADLEKALIKFVEPESQDTNIDIEDELDIDDIDLEETEDFLRRYFGNDWRETNPHLKDTFGIKENQSFNNKPNTLIETITARKSGYVLVLNNSKVLLDDELSGNQFAFGDYNDSSTWQQAAIGTKSYMQKVLNWAYQVYKGDYHLVEVEGKDEQALASLCIKEFPKLLDPINDLFEFLHKKQILSSWKNITLEDIIKNFDNIPLWLQNFLSGNQSKVREALDNTLYPALNKMIQDKVCLRDDLLPFVNKIITELNDNYQKYPDMISAYKSQKSIHEKLDNNNYKDKI